MILLYIFGGFILFLIIFFLYIRLKFRFWALQPVFHFYDVYYWFFNVGIIREELPAKNRYTNFKNIKTCRFEELNKGDLTRAILLIQQHYLQNKENTYSPKQENVLPYFLGHNHPTFWSIYYQPEVLIDQKTQTTIDSQKMVGVMTSRPLTVSIYINQTIKTMDVYYVDYLCVHKHWRKKQIAPQIIQTHEYVQSHQNRKISVSLFKREEELTGIIPLTIYTTYCFSMRSWNMPNMLNNQYSLLTGDKQNMYYLYNFIKEESTNNKWGITIMPAISNLIELVNTKNVFIKMIILDGNIVSAYIFKKTCTYIEAGKEILACIAAVNGSVLTNTDFIDGFKMSVWSLITDQNQKQNQNHFQYLIVEDISDNRCIIDNLMKKTFPLVSSPTAYFFYNFAYSTFPSNKCLIIN